MKALALLALSVALEAGFLMTLGAPAPAVAQARTATTQVAVKSAPAPAVRPARS